MLALSANLEGGTSFAFHIARVKEYVASAPGFVMRTKTSAAQYLPERISLSSMREAVDHCRGCELYKDATQAVFGKGPRHAHVMMIGEIPGDEEDRRGLPFVGPAGSLLRGGIEEAGLAVEEVYLTNAVKHFRWEARGKHRLHKKPGWPHIRACRPWLEAEIELIAPQIIVCLGATAAQTLLGSDFRVTRERGKFVKNQWAPRLMATYHPSAILRAPDELDRRRKHEEFVGDLRMVAEQLAAANK
jgi:uracil-DNA glycosylase